MYDFLLQLFFIGSLTAIIYLTARALPRVTPTSDGEQGGGSTFIYIEKWLKKLPLAKVDNAISRFFEKFLRKVRVVVLRVDNSIHSHLNNKKNSDKDQQGPDLFDQLKK